MDNDSHPVWQTRAFSHRLTLILRRLQLTQLDGNRRPLAWSPIAGVVCAQMSRTMGAGIAESRLADGVRRAECRGVRSGYLLSARGGVREAGPRGAGPGGAWAWGGGAGICCDRHQQAKILPQAEPRARASCIVGKIWRTSTLRTSIT